MAEAGVVMNDGRLIVAIVIGTSVSMRRLNGVDDVLETLATAAPRIVGIDASASSVYDQLALSLNVVKVDVSTIKDRAAILSKFTFLNILREEDKPAVMAAYLASENLT
jgi:hypothetical protein